jgi:hypothetical protein
VIADVSQMKNIVMGQRVVDRAAIMDPR